MTTPHKLTEQERLDAIRARLAARTPGRWVATCHRIVETAEPVGDGSYDGDQADVCEVLHYGVPGGGVFNHGTAEFIAHAPEDIDYLLALVDKLRAEQAALGLAHAHAYLAEAQRERDEAMAEIRGRR